MDCVIPREQYEFQRAKENLFIKKIKIELSNVLIFDPINQFCDQTSCYLIKNGKAIFRDHNHISMYGSGLLGNEIAKQYFNK